MKHNVKECCTIDQELMNCLFFICFVYALLLLPLLLLTVLYVYSITK